MIYMMFRSIILYICLVLFPVVSMEAISLLTLVVKNASRTETTLAQSFGTLISRHPWVSTEVTFGLYDPTVTQRYRPGQPQGIMEVEPGGFIHNGSQDESPNTYPAKPDNFFRIMLLGGSSMAGNALRSDNTQTIAAYLQRQLNSDPIAASTGLKFQVLNWEHSGAYSFTEAVRFLSDGVHVEPDMVWMFHTPY